MKKILGLLMALAFNTTMASDLFNNDSPRPYQIAAPLESGATAGGYPIWVGEGKWRLFNIAKRESTSTGATNVSIGDVGLFQTEDKKLVAIMVLSVNLTSAATRWLGEPCKRDDMLYKASIGKSTWEDNCVTINHITNFMHNPSGRYADLFAVLNEQKVEVPPTALQAKFTRNGTSGNSYSINLWINPEIVGIRREDEKSWARNPWHKSMMTKDPAKKQFIDALQAWALRFAKQMDLALDKNPSAFVPVSSWRNVLEASPVEGLIKPQSSLD